MDKNRGTDRFSKAFQGMGESGCCAKNSISVRSGGVHFRIR